MQYIIKKVEALLWKIRPTRGIIISKRRKKKREEFLIKLNKGTPILILTMGKVASSSIYSSLKSTYLGNVVHAHSFKVNHQDIEIQLLYNLYEKYNFNLKIISLLREPIGRNLSSFFQNFERDVGIKYENNDYSLKELQKIFLYSSNNDYPLTWFDYHIRGNFNIDVYEQPFPEEGYSLFKNKNVELLLMKHNIPDSIKENIIGDFVNIKNLKIFNENIGNQKKYANTYKKIQNLKVPDWYIEKMVNSNYVQHFFRNDIEKIIANWSAIKEPVS